MGELTYSGSAHLGNPSPPFYTLNNNSNQGNCLALYGVLAFSEVSFPMMALTWKYGLSGSPGSGDVPFNLDPRSPKHDGYTFFTQTGGAGPNTTGILWWADGRTWLTNGDIPLFILPPGYQAQVTQAAWGLVAHNAPTWCMFCWGYSE